MSSHIVASRNAISLDAELKSSPGRNQLSTLYQWSQGGRLSPDELNWLLARWWQKRFASAMDRQQLVAMFQMAGFVSDRNAHDRHAPAISPVDPPTQPMEVFRGAATNQPLGFSWTTNFDVAAFFACRNSRGSGDIPTAVFRTMAQPSSILGLIDLNEESEVIVNPFAIDEKAVELIDGRLEQVRIASRRRMEYLFLTRDERRQ